jgi:PKD repeat protein
VQFTDESTGNPATWSWNFGDGNTSTLENPTNTYVNDGTYSVTLTEGNSVGQNETTQAAYIVVGSSAPVAAFTASPVSGTAPLSVQFTDTSTNSPVSWIWNFGDGGTSTEENPSHIYSNPGTYTVSLTAANTAGENTATGSETVSTSEEMVAVQTPTLSLTPIPDTELPDISITGPATSGLAPLTVMFSANTPGSPEGFSWDFGDGGTSADEFPSYTYLNPGTYTVTLTVKYPSGTKTAVKNDFVTVSQKTSTSSPLPPVTTVIAIAVAAVLSLVISAKKRE